VNHVFLFSPGLPCDGEICNYFDGSYDTDSKTAEVTLTDRLLCEYDRVATPTENTTIVRLDLNLTRLTMVSTHLKVIGLLFCTGIV